MKLIKFIPFMEGKELVRPSVSKIPQWWKDGELTIFDDRPGLKSCIPFMEIMSSGYTINLPFDIFVAKSEDGDITIRWNSPEEGAWPNFVAERPKELGETIPRPAGHSPNHFVWSQQWGWKTPKGYSSIVCHPFNRFDLPFMTMSGIIDTDNYNLVPVNLPFFLKNNFEGVIKKGTPIAQIIIIKREDWNSKKMPYDPKSKYGLDNLKSVIEKSYKNRFWVKKKYE
jgi:hypothetical protein